MVDGYEIFGSHFHSSFFLRFLLFVTLYAVSTEMALFFLVLDDVSKIKDFTTRGSIFVEVLRKGGRFSPMCTTPQYVNTEKLG